MIFASSRSTMNVVLAGLLFAESGRTPAHAQTLARLEGSNVAWELDARSARIDTHLGRQALFLRANAPPAFAAATDLSDGTIEFEIAPLTGGNFVGLVFRYASATLHENIYFRLHRSGSFEAVQYAPRLHTAAGIWQLLPEFMATAIYQPGAWTRVRVEISGGRLQVLIGDTAMLALDVKRMKGVTATGRVGFWGRVNNRPEEWTAAISNIRITPRT